MKSVLDTLPRIPLRDQIIATIREAILLNMLAPGDKIPEQELANQLGVSRAPVREAIRVLEQQGLLETRPKVGTFVTQMSRADLDDGSHVRAALESFAVEFAIERLDRAQWADTCDKLSALLEEIREAVQRKDWSTATRLDIKWHEILVDSAHNTVLSQIYRQADLPMRFGAIRRLIAVPTPREYEASVGHHEELLATLRRCDPVECMQATRFHILRHIIERSRK